MIRNALVISVVIVFLSMFAGRALSADQEITGKQDESKTELQTREPAQSTIPSGEREDAFESNFFNEMERFLESRLPSIWEEGRRSIYSRRPLLGALLNRQTLRVDVIEHDDEFLIKAELPGVDKKDIHITISDNVVTIEADTRKEEEVEKGEYYYREISRGAFSRTLMLPAKVKENEAKASFERGVLELTIPKREEINRITIEVE